jgi:hypothetical protein
VVESTSDATPSPASTPIKVDGLSHKLSPTAAAGNADRHPAWCDRSRCTADRSTQAHGYRSGVGGEHRSAGVSLNLTAAGWPVPPHAVAWLSEAKLALVLSNNFAPSSCLKQQ